MRRILIFLFITAPLFAQYTSKDSALVRTTFYRTFDAEIINNYFSSDNPDSVRAALLSVSHSSDTTWLGKILDLDFDKYGDYISFAAGQIGESRKSAEYFFDKIFSHKENKYSRECYEAFGNTADSSGIDSLLNSIDKITNDNLSGLPYALNNFNSRYPLPNKSEFLSYLAEEIKGADSKKRKFDALFVLYRLGGIKDNVDVLTNILKSKESDANELKYYALGNLRRASLFPEDFSLVKELINDQDPMLRVEAARTVCFYPYKSVEELNVYLGLLKDDNQSVSRQAAISIGNVNTSDSLKMYIYDKIYELIDDDNLTENTRGELLVNYCNSHSDEYLDLIDDFEDEVDNSFIYRILSNNLSRPVDNFEYITDNLSDTSEIGMLNILNAALPLQDSLYGNEDYNNFILSILNSSSKIGITLVSISLDSTMIANNLNAIQQIVIQQIFNYFNDPDYSESLTAFYELAKNVSDNFSNQVLNIFATSRVKSLKSFAKKNQGKEISPEDSKDIEFNTLWSRAFQYSYAKVNTNKGTFSLKLSPRYAPISVGNFCYLASKKFYDNCKFHRVVPNFVIQTGDKSGTGWGGPGYSIISEFSMRPFDKAYVGMASSGKDTEGSQWFVMHSDYPHLDWRYTNFGYVTEGMDIVNKIDQRDKIINIELIK